MNNFGPTIEKLDSSWVEHWGKIIGSSRMANRIFQNERLSKRATHRIAICLGIDPFIELNPEEELSISHFSRDPVRLERLCGLVINGTILRTAVSQGEYTKITNQFTDEELKIAVTLHQLHPVKGEMGIALDKLPQLVENSGKSCIIAWRTSLSAQGALRLRLMDDANDTIGTPSVKIEPTLANQIVCAVIAASHKTPAIAAQRTHNV